MKPPPEPAASAVASLELGNESSPVPVASPLDNVENSPLDDIVARTVRARGTPRAAPVPLCDLRRALSHPVSPDFTNVFGGRPMMPYPRARQDARAMRRRGTSPNSKINRCKKIDSWEFASRLFVSTETSIPSTLDSGNVDRSHSGDGRAIQKARATKGLCLSIRS